MSPGFCLGVFVQQRGKCHHAPCDEAFKIKIFKNILDVHKVNMLRLWSCMLTCRDPMVIVLGASSTLAQSPKRRFGEELHQSACLSHVSRER